MVIDINEDSIIVILNGAKMKYEKISKSDVYPIIYSVLYELAIREKMVFVHSVVVFKKQRCFLLLGDFSSGKTTLGLAFEKNGWKIASYDQSIIKIEGKHVFLHKGSNYQSIDGEKGAYIKDNFSPLEINNAILIHGLSNHGELKIKAVNDFDNIYRGTWNRFMWPWYTPLTNRGELIKLNQEYVSYLYKFFEIFEKINFYSVRGDVKDIVGFFDDEKN